MRSLAVLIALVLLPNLLKAQLEEPIQSDRPSESIGANTVAKGTFQFEHGLEVNRNNSISFGNRNIELTDYTQENVLRYGIYNKLEFNTLVSLNKTYYKLPESVSPTDLEVSDFQLGLRYQLSTGESKFPALALQSRVVFKSPDAFGGDIFRGLNTTLTANQMLGEKAGLNVNLLALYRPDGLKEFQLAYTAAYNYQFTPKLAAFAEIFGNLNDFNLSADVGLAYLLNNNLQLDFSAGRKRFIGDSGFDALLPKNVWFGSVGVSWRLPNKKNQRVKLPE